MSGSWIYKQLRNISEEGMNGYLKRNSAFILMHNGRGCNGQGENNDMG